MEDEARDQTCTKQRGEVEQLHVNVTTLEALSGQGVCRQNTHDHTDDRTQRCVEDGVAVTDPDLLKVKDKLVGIQRKLHWPQNHTACLQCLGTGERAGYHKKAGVADDDDNQDQKDGGDNVKYAVTKGFIDLGRILFLKH